MPQNNNKKSTPPTDNEPTGFFSNLGFDIGDLADKYPIYGKSPLGQVQGASVDFVSGALNSIRPERTKVKTTENIVMDILNNKLSESKSYIDNALYNKTRDIIEDNKKEIINSVYSSTINESVGAATLVAARALTKQTANTAKTMFKSAVTSGKRRSRVFAQAKNNMSRDVKQAIEDAGQDALLAATTRGAPADVVSTAYTTAKKQAFDNVQNELAPTILDTVYNKTSFAGKIGNAVTPKPLGVFKQDPAGSRAAELSKIGIEGLLGYGGYEGIKAAHILGGDLPPGTPTVDDAPIIRDPVTGEPIEDSEGRKQVGLPYNPFVSNEPENSDDIYALAPQEKNEDPDKKKKRETT